MLVERVDAARDAFAEADPGCDAGAALAARLHEFVRQCVGVARDVQKASSTPAEPLADAGMAQQKPNDLRAALLVDGFEAVFDRAFVAAIELPEPLGVAAAAGILEKDRVVEIDETIRAEPEPPADLHADPAAAQAVTRGMPFGQVEREAERADQFREPETEGRVAPALRCPRRCNLEHLFRSPPCTIRGRKGAPLRPPG